MRAACNSGVTSGTVMTSPTKVAAANRDTATGIGSSADMPRGVALTRMSTSAGSSPPGPTRSPNIAASLSISASRRIAVVNGERRHTALEQGERDRASGAARADQERAASFEAAARLCNPVGKSLAVEHVAMPAAVGIAPRHIGRPKKTRALRQGRAMRDKRKLMRNRRDQSVDIGRARQRRDPRPEVGRRDL